MKTSPQVDQYILKSADFAQDILNHLRLLVHHACPDVNETIKWGFPHFEYKEKILCYSAAFKYHCTFGFWNGDAVEDSSGVLEKVGRTAMGHLGKIKALDELPDDELMIELIHSAMKKIDGGEWKISKSQTINSEKKYAIPHEFAEALKSNSLANQNFGQFSVSKRKEYLEWFNEAKTEATRIKRIQTAIDWISEGKSRNWKYIK